METERNRKKFYLIIIAVLVGCVVILGPKLIFSSIQSTSLSTVKNDRNEASCQCGILFESDVADYPNIVQLCDMLSIGDVSQSHLKKKKFQKNVDGPLRKIEKCKRELPKFCEQELKRVALSGTLLGGLNEKQVNILHSCSKQTDERRKLKHRKHYSYGNRKDRFQGYKPYFRQVIDSESSSPFQADSRKKGAMVLATPVFMLGVAVFFFYVFFKFVLKENSSEEEADISTDHEREFDSPHQEVDSKKKKTLEDYGNEQVADVLKKALSEVSTKLGKNIEVKVAEETPVIGKQTLEKGLISNVEHLQSDQDESEGSKLSGYDEIKSEESAVFITETTKDLETVKPELLSSELESSESLEVENKDLAEAHLDPYIGKATEVPLSQDANLVKTQTSEDITEFLEKKLSHEESEPVAEAKLIETSEVSKMPVEEVKPIGSEQLIAVEEYICFTNKLSEKNVKAPVESSQAFIVGIPEKTSEELRKISTIENVELVELESAQMSAAEDVMEIPKKTLDETSKLSIEEIIEQVESVQIPAAEEDILKIPGKTLDEISKVSTEEQVELIESVQMSTAEEEIMEIPEKTLDKTSKVYTEERIDLVGPVQMPAAKEKTVEIPEKMLDETSKLSTEERIEQVESAQISTAEGIMEIPEKMLETSEVSTEEKVKLLESVQMPAAKEETVEIPEKMLETSEVSTEEKVEHIESVQMPATEEDIMEIPEKMLETSEVSTEEKVELIESVQEPDVEGILDKIDELANISSEEKVESAVQYLQVLVKEVPEKTSEEPIYISEEKVESGLEPSQKLRTDNHEEITTESEKISFEAVVSSIQKDVKILNDDEKRDATGCIILKSGDGIKGSNATGNNLLESGVTREPEGQFLGPIKNTASSYVMIDSLTNTTLDKVTTPYACQKSTNETVRNISSTDQQATLLDSSGEIKLEKFTTGNSDHEEMIVVKDIHQQEDKDITKEASDAESVHKESQKHEEALDFVGSWDKQDILGSKDVQVFLEDKQSSSVEKKEKAEHGAGQLDVSEL
ncbi:probable GPI-anchored adhesin-like protein PGA55 isoform X3 [Limulus polyphemus]|uniref:Probable GPI-anchored adhesin-like protein PGA55 isoform X3 n=1 Tax=Limulus polyphemus TaxID=6850 RepID=A0ABM1BWI7_LIMPO|nr:probable GPI-anchored adhesin-like protein PGA55 isoform X3 [Limulus polyphemus]